MTQNENQVFIIDQQNNTESNFGSVSILAFNVPEFCTWKSSVSICNMGFKALCIS